MLAPTGKSLTKKIWQYQPSPDIAENANQAEAFRDLLNQAHLPDFVINFFLTRKIAPQQITHYLNPKIKHSLPEPFALRDLEKAVYRIQQAILAGKNIALYSDYDVDGACSAALLTNYFTALKIPTQFYIPNRITQGYGIHRYGLEKLRDDGANLILCTDLGASTTNEITGNGLPDIIIIDHHQTHRPYPEVYAFIDPMREDDSSIEKSICATTITFLLLIALNRALRALPAYEKILPDLMDSLDLVALATIADVMPLQGINRDLVAQGMKQMNTTTNLGLHSLNELCRKGEKITTTEDVSFKISPYLNAAGRMGESRVATLLLTATTKKDAYHYAERLLKLNTKRISVQNDCLQNIHSLLTKEAKPKHQQFVLIGASNLHIGITGITAGKIKDQYHAPALIISYDHQGLGTGSARSVAGIDIAKILEQATHENILIRSGGHAMAGGFTLQQNRESDLRIFLHRHINEAQNSEITQADYLQIDGVCGIPSLASLQLKWLETLAPFGAGNPKPLFALPDLRVKYLHRMGQKNNHIMIVFCNQSRQELRGVLFNCDTEPHNILTNTLTLARETQEKLDVAGYFQVNHYHGKQNLQILLSDLQQKP